MAVGDWNSAVVSETWAALEGLDLVAVLHVVLGVAAVEVLSAACAAAMAELLLRLHWPQPCKSHARREL